MPPTARLFWQDTAMRKALASARPPSLWTAALRRRRIGHLPDYSFIRYRYLPAWADYEEVIKDNLKEYLHAFAQMIYAMKWMRREIPALAMDSYAWDVIAPLRDDIEAILTKR